MAGKIDQAQKLRPLGDGIIDQPQSNQPPPVPSGQITQLGRARVLPGPKQQAQKTPRCIVVRQRSRPGCRPGQIFMTTKEVDHRKVTSRASSTALRWEEKFMDTLTSSLASNPATSGPRTLPIPRHRTGVSRPRPGKLRRFEIRLVSSCAPLSRSGRFGRRAKSPSTPPFPDGQCGIARLIVPQLRAKSAPPGAKNGRSPHKPVSSVNHHVLLFFVDPCLVEQFDTQPPAPPQRLGNLGEQALGFCPGENGQLPVQQDGRVKIGPAVGIAPFA